MIDLSPFQISGLTGGLINEMGQIAGGLVVDGVYSPAVFESQTRQVRPLGSLGGNTDGFNGTAASVNDLGQAVGYSYLDPSTRHAFLYSQGALIDIDSFGGYSVATAINHAGQIVGFAAVQKNGTAHAFLYTAGAMIDIDPLGAANFSSGESYARDINNRGQVVGEFLTADRRTFHAFLYSAGAFTDLGSVDSPETAALAINEQGQIVGITSVPYKDICYDDNLNQFVPCIKYKSHAFLYEKGQLTDLNTLIRSDSGWELTWALDINNHGQIVGYGLRQGHFRAFLLTPIRSAGVLPAS